MKHSMNRTRKGFTLHELVVVIGVITVMGLLSLRALAQVGYKSHRIVCADNLKRIGTAFRLWAYSHVDRFPQSVDISQGGAKNGTINLTGADTYKIYKCMSNELKTPKLLLCPSDGQRVAGTNFANPADFGNLRVSYFAGRDCDASQLTMFLAGDRNVYGNSASTASPTAAVLASYGNSPTTSAGLLQAIGTNIVENAPNPPPVGFTDKMHRRAGDVAMADGSTQQYSSGKFYTERSQTGDGTGLIPPSTAPFGNVLMFP